LYICGIERKSKTSFERIQKFEEEKKMLFLFFHKNGIKKKAWSVFIFFQMKLFISPHVPILLWERGISDIRNQNIVM
jgi:hypothetical protein